MNIVRLVDMPIKERRKYEHLQNKGRLKIYVTVDGYKAVDLDEKAVPRKNGRPIKKKG